MVMLPPTNLAASLITETSFTVSWTAPAGTNLGYNVLISTDGGNSNTYLDTIYTTSYNFTISAPGVPLVTGTTYQAAVQAFGNEPTEYSEFATLNVTTAGVEPPPDPDPEPGTLDGPVVLVRNAAGSGWERRKWQVRNADNTAWIWG